MNNLFSIKKDNSLNKDKLQIRNYLVQSIIFTIFASICISVVVKSVDDPLVANAVQKKLCTYHIIILHALGFSTLLVGAFSEKKTELESLVQRQDKRIKDLEARLKEMKID